MNNNATIENSTIGISVGYASNSRFNGGIVQVNNTTFRNNKQNAAFYSYRNVNNLGEEINNISYFSNCTFITDSETLHNTHSYNVILNGIKGVRFSNCHFIENRTNIQTNGIRNGIMASNSSFMVRGSSFNNLRYGIYAVSSTGAHSFSVKNSSFNALQGIYFNANDNVQITNNSFNVISGYNTINSIKCENRSYGVYIDNAFNFKIENNWFQGIDNDGVICGKVGVIVKNTGTYSTEIYRNFFENLTVGIEAIGNNRGVEDWSGLELICNNFTNSNYDIFVKMPSQAQRPSGIKGYQGSYSKPAGNLFSTPSGTLQSHFVNEGDRIDYFHHAATAGYNLIPHYNISGNIFRHPADPIFNPNTSCPNRILERPYPELIAVLDYNSGLYAEKTQQLKELIDAGDSDDLKRRIDESGPGADIPLYQFLMQNAPFLSEDVLAKLAAKEKGFSNVMIRNVLVKSPQSPKLAKVVEKLDNRNIPLPPPMRKLIDEGLDYFGEKELMEQEAAYYKSLYDLALNEIISNKIHETEGWEDVPEISDILNQINDLRYQYLLAEIYFSEGDYEQGMQLLGDIEVAYDLNGSGYYSDHLDYISFYSLIGQIDLEEYPDYLNLPEDILQTLESYIASDNRIAGKALSLLIMNEAIEYEEPVYFPEIVLNPKSDDVFDLTNISDDLSIKQNIQFNIYPNPAQKHVTVSWCYDTSKKASVTVEVYNSAGVLVHSFTPNQNCGSALLDISGWISGNYTTVLNLEKARAKSINFILAK
jgi:hypothetical protein